MNFITNLFSIKVNNDRVFGLDLLRFFAILFVILLHCDKYLPNSLKQLNSFFSFDGVSIFFVLSGFLIGGILIRLIETTNITIKTLFKFWSSRWMRTLPNYFFVLLILIILSEISDTVNNVDNYLEFFVFSQNIETAHPSFFPEAWSLSVEEWFYIITPITIIIITHIFKVDIKFSILLTIILILLFSTAFRYYRYDTYFVSDSVISWDYNYRKQVITRLDSLMYGLLGAYLKYYYAFFWKIYKSILFYIGISLILIHKFLELYIDEYVNNIYYPVFSFSLISLGTLLLLPALDSLKKSKFKASKIITKVSLISYSMYLINYSLIQHYLLDNIDLNNSLKLILFLSLTYFISILLYKFIEVPFMKLRDKKTSQKTPLEIQKATGN